MPLSGSTVLALFRRSGLERAFVLLKEGQQIKQNSLFIFFVGINIVLHFKRRSYVVWYNINNKFMDA